MGNLSQLATELGGNESELTAFVQRQRGRVPGAGAPGSEPAADDRAAAARADRDEHRAHRGGDAGADAAVDAGAAGAERPGAGADAVGSAAVLYADHAGAPRPAAAVLGQGSADRQAAGAGHARSGQGDARADRRWPASSTTSSTSSPTSRRTARATCSTCPGPATTRTRCSPARTSIGPVRRGLILFSCGSLQLLQDLAKPTHNPTLATLIQLLTTPDLNAHCTSRGTPK